jgi:hypothetical protein
MNPKEQLLKQIEELQNKLKELENSNFQLIKHNKKEFRVYKWENKKFSDFPIPKGYNFAEFSDVTDMINKKKLIFTEPYKETYICKNILDNKNYLLSRVCFGRSGNVFSNGGDLQYSYDDGRVVLVKQELKK